MLQSRNKHDIAAKPVAANLPGMKNLTYEKYLAEPALREQIAAAARRAQAIAMHRYLLQPLVRFCGRLVAVRGFKLRLDPRVAVR